MANPVIKWAGGKRHIAVALSRLAPREFGAYFEPFLGGAAMFLHLNPKDSILSDTNEELVNLYRILASSADDLFDQIEIFGKEYDLMSADFKSAAYYEIRDRFNKTKVVAPDSRSASLNLDQACNFYVLNKLSFNGLYRENKAGLHNVPFNGRQRFPFPERVHFKEVQSRLSSARLLSGDFEEASESAVAGDFVYFDPPYVPVSETASFTSYSKVGFGKSEQIRLAELMRALKKRGVYAMTSNSDTAITRDIYLGLDFEEILAPRAISAKASTRGPSKELVIRNFS